MKDYSELPDCNNLPSDDELAQAMYEVAGAYVEGGEYHCRRGDMPRIARNLLARYGCPAAQQDASAAQDTLHTTPLTERKTREICAMTNYRITGYVLTDGGGDKCISDRQAVRWMGGDDFFKMMHTPTVTTSAQSAPLDAAAIRNAALEDSYRAAFAAFRAATDGDDVVVDMLRAIKALKTDQQEQP